MCCREIMSQDVQWVGPDDTAARAARLMAFNNLGFLPVCSDDGIPLGVLADRDIALRVVGEDRPGAKTKVGEVMTAPIQFVPPECPVDRVGELMTETNVSHVLVVESDGHLKGVVSLANLLVHERARRAMKIARSVYARKMPDRSVGHPHPAPEPAPEYFHGAREFTTDESGAEHPARWEAEEVNRGDAVGFREFP